MYVLWNAVPVFKKWTWRFLKFGLSESWVTPEQKISLSWPTFSVFVRDHAQILTTKLVALGLVACLSLFPVTGNRHGWVPSPTWYMIEVIGACVDGPIRRGMTLTTIEIARLVVFWAWSIRETSFLRGQYLRLKKLFWENLGFTVPTF